MPCMQAWRKAIYATEVLASILKLPHEAIFCRAKSKQSLGTFYRLHIDFISVRDPFEAAQSKERWGLVTSESHRWRYFWALSGSRHHKCSICWCKGSTPGLPTELNAKQENQFDLRQSHPNCSNRGIWPFKRKLKDTLYPIYETQESRNLALSARLHVKL